MLYGALMKNEIVFALFKDEVIGSKDHFRSKIKKYIKDVNVNELFIRITNYQIDKYGLPLTIDTKIPSKEDCKKMAYIAKSRYYARKKYNKDKEERKTNANSDERL